MATAAHDDARRLAAVRHLRPTCGRPWTATAARAQLRRTAARAGVRRRFAPHQLRHAHAVEMAREQVPLVVIQRQLGHGNLGITSMYIQGIDSSEIIDTVHARRAPMIPASAGLACSSAPLDDKGLRAGRCLVAAAPLSDIERLQLAFDGRPLHRFARGLFRETSSGSRGPSRACGGRSSDRGVHLRRRVERIALAALTTIACYCRLEHAS
ncbi:tyrosine-type recombinase/integrase [Gaiella sp.]|uniref:tyrosine-type recombinase/integrase n=1 Tax=Gaiella sp. TaxID=2663207 RepID=UPI003983CE8E